MTMMTWRPLWDTRFPSLRDEMDKMFEEFFEKVAFPSTREHSWSPVLDLYETMTDVIVVMDVPGVDPKGVTISILEDSLTIKGERKREPEMEGGECCRSERISGMFQRVIQLPSQVTADKARATYKDGVLTIVVPKVQKRAPREIIVEVQ